MTRSHDEEDRVERSIAQWAVVAPGLDVSPMEVFGRIHRVFALYNTHINRVFTQHGMSAAGFEVLAALFRAGAPYRLSVSRLTHETLISSGGMTMRLDRLERDGLIVRERALDDRRIVFASLTERAVALVADVAAVHFANEAVLLKGIDPDDRQHLSGLLSDLERCMRHAEGGS
ncbi:MAG: MarR family transcriptional regulator [Aeromicrobium sp.]